MAGKKKKAAAASTRTDSKKSTKKAGKKSVKKVAETPATDRLQRVYAMSFASVYPHYVAKAERKGRTKAEVDKIIHWLTGYTLKKLDTQLEKQTDFETFFARAPRLNPSRNLITGVVCGVRVEDVKEPTMREIRYLDKLIDELAKGRTMEKILRQ